jgi:cytochrome c5
MLAKISLAAVLLVGCGQASPRPEAGQDTTATPSSPELDRLMLASAKKYCTACHELPSPNAHSATDWPVIIRRMWLRTDRVAPDFEIPIPTSAERVMMIRYLVENALQVSDRALRAAPGRDAFSETCSRCHELPDPMQHPSQDWAAVVQRMAQHVEDILDDRLSGTEVRRITSYLETVATP